MDMFFIAFNRSAVRRNIQNAARGAAIHTKRRTPCGATGLTLP